MIDSATWTRTESESALTTTRKKLTQGPPSGLAGLWFGVLLFRWASFAWMAVLTLGTRDLRYPQVAWFVLGAVAAWSAYLTIDRRWDRPTVLWFDLALSTCIILASGLVAQPGQVIGGDPFFATAYPISTVLTWGVARGPWGGLASGLILSIAVGLSRPLNGVPLSSLDRDQVLSIANGAVYYLAAGGTIGLIARLLRKQTEEIRVANEDSAREQARAARLAEREVIARRIHDSALQSLSLITKRGREIAAGPTIESGEVLALASIAEREQRQLRTMIAREDEEAPTGRASLRELIEHAALHVDGPPVNVSATGPVWLPAADAEELTAAVRQALGNVVNHAQATSVAIFIDEEDAVAIVSVRDDGVGFDYDPEALKAQGKLGVLKSMRGRAEDLGGSMQITSAPGVGTEVEFRIPIRAADEDDAV